MSDMDYVYLERHPCPIYFCDVTKLIVTEWSFYRLYMFNFVRYLHWQTESRINFVKVKKALLSKWTNFMILLEKYFRHRFNYSFIARVARTDRFETRSKSVLGWQQSIDYGLEGLDGPLYSGEMEFLNRPLSDIYANQSVEIDARDFIRRHKLSGKFSRPSELLYAVSNQKAPLAIENCSKLIRFGKYHMMALKHCWNAFNWD